jgi:hypothetical protein
MGQMSRESAGGSAITGASDASGLADRSGDFHLWRTCINAGESEAKCSSNFSLAGTV